MPDLLAKYNTKKADDGRVMVLKDPETNKPVIDETTKELVTITLLGRDSDIYTRLQQQQQTRRLKDMGRKGKLTATAEDIDVDALALLVACTRGWKHIKSGSNEELPFNPGNAEKLYTDLPFVREQVADFIDDRSNFLGN